MRFNRYLHLEGRHAFLSPSSYHWINYDEEKLVEKFKNHRMDIFGSELHEWAAFAIKHGLRQSRSKKTLNQYINDGIGFKMDTEVMLYYSDNCFGTADAISFKNKVLRIHDLKTGKNKAYPQQLFVYAALFCLEYDVKPSDIQMELRIYQNDEVRVFIPEVPEIVKYMDTIIRSDAIIESLKG